MISAYQKLEEKFSRISTFSDVLGILHWDGATMMPRGAGVFRGEQLSELSALRHQMVTEAEIVDLIAEAKQEQLSLTDWQRANLRAMDTTVTLSRLLPEELVKAKTKAEVACELTWRSAREENDFTKLLPELREVLSLQQEAAQAKAEYLGCSLYEALLNDYDPECKVSDIEDHFETLSGFLPDFIQKVLEKQKTAGGVDRPDGPFEVSKQESLGRRVMGLIGFDFNRGRLDVSTHPFCGGATNDVRITTRYDEFEFTSSLMGVMHETGHAVYEQNRPADWLKQPVGQSAGMTIHESQSLIIEMQAGRSQELISFLAPLMVEEFCGDRALAGASWRAENLHRLYTKVEPGFIRVDADEVTYPAHIILRYRLEKAMIEGTLDLADLPTAWNEAMQDLLGITPPNDTVGCLQDIHWPSGGWGYFPTYTLGAMTAAQLFQKAVSDNYDVLSGLERGDFTPLVGWLTEKIHSKGSYYPNKDGLLEAATGEKLSVKPFIRHLENRYLMS